jgi:hypothetical protein
MRKLELTVSLVIVSYIFATGYVVVQQSQRLAANDIPVQRAQDTANQLNAGKSPEDFAAERVDMGKSLASFLIIYDKNDGRVVFGTGYLDGQVPTIPYGVLASSQYKPYNAVTWQPRQDVRVASVTVAADKYYVLGGRSLKEVEARADHLLKLVVFGWFVAVLTIASYYMWFQHWGKTRAKRSGK